MENFRPHPPNAVIDGTEQHKPFSYAQKAGACEVAMKELDQGGITPYEALDRVLFAYNALPDYDTTPLDPRLNGILNIEMSRATARNIRSIAKNLDAIESNLPDEQQTRIYGIPPREFASLLDTRIETNAYELFGPLMGQYATEDARSLFSTPQNPHPELYKDNSTALSTVLLEEQLAAANVSKMADFVELIKQKPVVDPFMILDIIKAQDEFYDAHALIDNDEKRASLEQVLNQFDAIDDKINEQHLPIAKAIVLRLSAQGIRDIGRLSGDIGMRRACIKAALRRLGEIGPVDLSERTASSSVNLAIRKQLARSTTQQDMSGLDQLREKINFFIAHYYDELKKINEQLIGRQAVQPTTLPHAA